MDQEVVLNDTITKTRQIRQILEDVDCLLDLTNDHIERLKQLVDGPLIIRKFDTSLGEFDYWSSSAGEGIKDVGLDENYEFFVIRWRYVWAVEGIRNFMLDHESLRFKRSLNNTTRKFYLTVRSKSELFFPF